MVIRGTVKAFLALLISVSMIGAANHCAFEDLFVAVSEKIFSIAAPDHLAHHLGSTSKHRHQDSTDPHQHGEPHSFMTMSFVSGVAELGEVVLDDIFVAYWPVIVADNWILSRESERTPARTSSDPPRPQSFADIFLASPQAPPVRV